MTRIAFTADLHVDEYGSRRDAATGLNARLVDYLATLRWLADQASDEQECGALVIAGDFTERRHPAPWLVSQIRDALSVGPSRQVYLRGNHDGEIAGGSIVSILDDGIGSAAEEEWRAGVSVPQLQPISFEAVLACIPYIDRHWLRAQAGFADVTDAEVYQVLAAQFLTIARGLYAEAKRDYPDAGVVLVCHQTLAGAHLSESQQAFLGDQQLVVSVADLEAIGFEGIVAGHLHRHQALSATTLYAGSIERVDFGEEGDAKGFVVADVGPGRFEWQFIETPARAFVTLRGDVNADDLPASELDGAIVRAIDVAPSTDLEVLRTRIEKAGAFEITQLTHAPVATAAIAGGLAETLSAEQALEAYFEGDPDVDALIERGRRILEAVGA
jgi:exonuclease SbcD